MPEAAILEELLKIVNDGDDQNKLSPELTNKLVLACVVEIYKQQKALAAVVEPLVQQMKVIRWVGSIFVGLVLVLVWEILTHRAVVTFP
jgi:hypothetical protein